MRPFTVAAVVVVVAVLMWAGLIAAGIAAFHSFTR